MKHAIHWQDPTNPDGDTTACGRGTWRHNPVAEYTLHAHIVTCKPCLRAVALARGAIRRSRRIPKARSAGGKP